MNPVEGGRISIRQAVFLLAIAPAATGVLYLPAAVAAVAKQDSWMVPFLATLIPWGIVALLAWLARRHPGQTLVQIAETTLGRVPGKALSGLFILWLLHISPVIHREMTELINTSVLEQTPLQVVEAVTALAGAILVVLGLEVIARTNEIVFPGLLAAFTALLLLAAKDFRLERLAPVLEHGVRPVLQAAVAPSAFRGEVVLLGMIMPFLEQPKRVLTVGLWAAFLPALLLAGVTAGSLMLFGAEETARFLSAPLEMARTIQVGDIVERIEAVAVAVWMAGMYVKIAFFHYVTVLALAQWAGLSDYRPLVFPVVALEAVLSVGLFDNVLELMRFLTRTWGPYGLAVEVGFPSFLLLASLLRGAGKGHLRQEPAKGGGRG